MGGRRYPPLTNGLHRLAAIGPCTLETAMTGEREILWMAPAVFASDLATFDLRFYIYSESRHAEPDEELLALWDRYRRNQPA